MHLIRFFGSTKTNSNIPNLLGAQFTLLRTSYTLAYHCCLPLALFEGRNKPHRTLDLSLNHNLYFGILGSAPRTFPFSLTPYPFLIAFPLQLPHPPEDLYPYLIHESRLVHRYYPFPGGIEQVYPEPPFLIAFTLG